MCQGGNQTLKRPANHFKGRDIRYDFGDYGKHSVGCIRFILTAYKDLP